MTGAELAMRLRKRVPLHVGVAKGVPCRYEPRERMVYLSPEVYDGETHSAHAIVAHEVAHSQQHAVMGGAWIALFARIEPVALWLEWRAWDHAMRLLHMELPVNFESLGAWKDTRRACLITDIYRAAAYCAGAAAIFGLAIALRK